jgi:hypothetical protein
MLKSLKKEQEFFCVLDYSSPALSKLDIANFFAKGVLKV